MRMPEINSRQMRILQALRRKAMTLDQGIESHGSFTSKSLPDGVERSKVLELYCDLVDRGCIVKEGILYRLHLACKHKLERMDLRMRPDVGAVAAKIVIRPPNWTIEDLQA
jgi:hypothetical protein